MDVGARTIRQMIIVTKTYDDKHMRQNKLLSKLKAMPRAPWSLPWGRPPPGSPLGVGVVTAFRGQCSGNQI
eukprot:8035752-Lingulodinium_polyedra.AAC.1